MFNEINLKTLICHKKRLRCAVFDACQALLPLKVWGTKPGNFILSQRSTVMSKHSITARYWRRRSKCLVRNTERAQSARWSDKLSEWLNVRQSGASERDGRHVVVALWRFFSFLLGKWVIDKVFEFLCLNEGSNNDNCVFTPHENNYETHIYETCWRHAVIVKGSPR